MTDTTANLTYTTIRQPNGDIRVTEFANGEFKDFSDVGSDSIRYVIEDLKGRGYTPAHDTTTRFSLIANITMRIAERNAHAETITAYLSNRTDPSIYTVTAENFEGVEFWSMNGQDWMTADAAPVTTYAPTQRRQGVPHWVRNTDAYEGAMDAEEAIAELKAVTVSVASTEAA